MLELNVAIVLFLIAIVSTLGILSFCTAAAKKTNEFSQSAHLAQSKMAEILHLNADQITEVTMPAAFPSPFEKYRYTIKKLNPPDSKLSGFKEIKVTVTGLTGAKTCVVAIKTTLTSAPVWYNLYGGEGDETAYCISDTTDGGYIVAGSAQPEYANGKYYGVLRVIKLNSDGTISWQKDIGGQNCSAVGVSIQQTRDGGYIVSGTNYSNRDNKQYIWIIKLSTGGAVSWQKAFLETAMQSADVIKQTSDEGFIVTGFIQKTSGPEPYIMKLTPTGGIAWQKAYAFLGGGSGSRASAVQQTSDGGYIVAGKTQEYQRDGGITKAFITKFNPNGTLAWQKAYGNKSAEITSALQTADGGYIISGRVMYGAYIQGALVAKLNPDGTLAWQKAFQGGQREQMTANSIRQTADGGYIVAGDDMNTSSYYNQKGIAWMAKLNADGATSWKNTYGQLNSSPAYNYKDDYSKIKSVQQNSDGGYAAAGAKTGINASGYSHTDMMVFTVDSNGNNSYTIVKNTGITEANPGLIEYSQSRNATNSNLREAPP